MAKRKAKARTRKSARRTSKAALRKRPKSVRKPALRRRAKAKTTRRPSAPRRRASASARRAGTGKKVSKKASKSAAQPRLNSSPAKKVAATKAPAARPKPAALQRERRQLREDEAVLGPPSTLGYSPKASSAESGHAMYTQRRREHTEGGPSLTAGEIDSDWNDAYSSGEETPGGDMSTPDQDVVDEIGRALGVEYEDAEELKGSEKIEERDKHRWEYDPASAEDYRDRNKKQ